MNILSVALLPITVVTFGITFATIYDVSRKTHTSNGGKGSWILLIALFNVLGVFIYYRYGRLES